MFRSRYGTHCSCGGTFSRIKGRKQYHCSRCSFQVAPLAGTIFEKSKIPLTMWFHALMMFSNAKSGLSAKTIQRDLEITYKCAWRMAHLIRGALKQSEEPLHGDVELDLAFFGGKGDAGKNLEHLRDVFRAKTKVLAAIERVFRNQKEVGVDALRIHGLVKGRLPVKVLGDGALTAAFKISAHAFSGSAREKIQKAGGEAVLIKS